MRTLIFLFVDTADAGRKERAHAMLATLPPWQVEAAFADFCPRCPDHLEAEPLLRRPANALNVEPIQPGPRCRLRTPEEWGQADPRAARWLLSGGAPGVLGLCSLSGCPRAKAAVPAA